MGSDLQTRGVGRRCWKRLILGVETIARPGCPAVGLGPGFLGEEASTGAPLSWMQISSTLIEGLHTLSSALRDGG